MKNKKKLKQLQRQLTYANTMLQRICSHLGLSTATHNDPVNLTSFNNIMKELYPSNLPSKMAKFDVSQFRKNIDEDDRFERMEEIASKMTASDTRAIQEENNEVGPNYEDDDDYIYDSGEFETVTQEAHFDERDVVSANVKPVGRVPVNLRLGF